jgi:hypothetical protein
MVATVSTSPLESHQAKPKGLKVQWMGHSFHAFLPSPVASLAKEAGIQGHVSLGMDMIPGSYPCQHWNKNPNTVKQVLAAGTADVLTIASRETAPDDCIPKWADLAISIHNQISLLIRIKFPKASRKQGYTSDGSGYVSAN